MRYFTIALAAASLLSMAVSPKAAEVVPGGSATETCAGYDLQFMSALSDEGGVEAPKEVVLDVARRVCAARKLCMSGNVTAGLAAYRAAVALLLPAGEASGAGRSAAKSD